MRKKKKNDEVEERRNERELKQVGHIYKYIIFLVAYSARQNVKVYMNKREKDVEEAEIT